MPISTKAYLGWGGVAFTLLAAVFLLPLLEQGKSVTGRMAALQELGRHYVVPEYIASEGSVPFNSFHEFFDLVEEQDAAAIAEATETSGNPFPGLLLPGNYERLDMWPQSIEASEVPFIWWQGQDSYGLTPVLFLNGVASLIPRQELDLRIRKGEAAYSYVLANDMSM